jgi:cytidylate kinase
MTGEGEIVIAIDGPAGSGKTSVARLVAAELGLRTVETGAMYRALTLKALDTALSLDDETGLTDLAAATSVELRGDRVFMDGLDVTEAIRSERVTASVSKLSAHPRVREWMVKQQRALASGGGVVMEGRDITTVVLPDAHLKVFLTASPQVRARRRSKELAESGIAAEESSTLQELAERDHIDSKREASPLAVAQDAVVLDTTRMTLGEVVEAIVGRARELKL